MIDGYGRPMVVSARVRWPWDPSRAPDDENYRHGAKLLVGTVRAVDEDTHQVRVDDGAAGNPDLTTNGYVHSEWVYAADTEILPCTSCV